MIDIGNHSVKTLCFSVGPLEYIFLLFRHQLDSQIPRSIDVYNPDVNIKVTINISESKDSSNLYHLFTHQNFIQICLDALQKVLIISI